MAIAQIQLVSSYGWLVCAWLQRKSHHHQHQTSKPFLKIAPPLNTTSIYVRHADVSAQFTKQFAVYVSLSLSRHFSCSSVCVLAHRRLLLHISENTHTHIIVYKKQFIDGDFVRNTYIHYVLCNRSTTSSF